MVETIPFPASMTDRTATGIAHAIGRLISTGDLATGSRLPTVRAVARQLDVSPTTVAEAWRILQHHGAIATEGRRGTFVRGARQVAPGRYWQVPVDPGTFALDLSTGTPDPALLPPLGPLLGRLELDPHVTSYLDAPVVPELAKRLRDDWPFEPELLTVVDGAQDALDRHDRPVVVHGHTDGPGAGQIETIEQRREFGVGHHHGIAQPDHGADQAIERVLGPVDHGQQLRLEG
ncbi:MAG: GntR family transcriptional regulator, partial [Actinomycetota bacterium]